MNQPTDAQANQSNQSAILSAAARSQAPWAAIAALAMLYFGFAGGAFDEAIGAQIIAYTLRCGGVAMALSAILLATGKPFSLLFDGVAAMLIGVGLAIGAIMWFVAIGSVDLQGILEIVFGYVFFTSGKRSFTDYTRLNPLFVEEDAATVSPHTNRSHDPTPSQPAQGSLASKLIEQQRAEPNPPGTQTETAPPPEGYLSSFADDRDRTDTDS